MFLSLNCFRNDSFYKKTINKQTITARKATPSISAADTIMFERISPAASGWRAILSIALPPIFPIPKPAPIAANPAPKVF